MTAPSLSSLDNTVLSCILSFCTPHDCDRFGTLNKTWLTASRADNVWHRWAKTTFQVDSCVGPRGEECSCWRQSYLAWSSLFHKRQLERCLVAVNFWARFKAWAADAFPELLQTLRPGLSPQELAAAEAQFGYRLPDELAALYLLHDGQEDHRPGAGWHHRTLPLGPLGPRDLLGMFGSHMSYDHLVSTAMVPLATACELSAVHMLPPPPPRADAHAQGGAVGRRETVWGGRPQILTVAMSVPMADTHNALVPQVLSKAVGVDCVTGEVVGLGIEQSVFNLVQTDAADKPASPLETWLNTYVDRLRSGTYAVSTLADLDSSQYFGGHRNVVATRCRCISLIPETGSMVGEAVTNGIRVRASVVPEIETSKDGMHTFAYCIRFSHVLPEGAKPQLGAVAEAQLALRHWRCCTAGGRQYDHIRGPGVIGQYPIISPGCREFSYQSKTVVRALGHYMDGSFTFVTGTVNDQTGPQFEVVCPRLRFVHPGCIY